MLKDGFELMIVGMGVVFAFLTLLVLCLTVASRILRRFPDEEPSTPQPSQPLSRASSRGLVAAAIAAAQRTRDQAP
ncbi:MAG: OadG family transporter subunit [Verrucomicrobiota bacterium]|nr:OadG family transporter subunit [Verrucomicrobiota bacterium]